MNSSSRVRFQFGEAAGQAADSPAPRDNRDGARTCRQFVTLSWHSFFPSVDGCGPILRLRAMPLCLRVGLHSQPLMCFRCSQCHYGLDCLEKFQRKTFSQTVAAVYDRRRFPAVYDRCYSRRLRSLENGLQLYQRLFIWPELTCISYLNSIHGRALYARGENPATLQSRNAWPSTSKKDTRNRSRQAHTAEEPTPRMGRTVNTGNRRGQEASPKRTTAARKKSAHQGKLIHRNFFRKK